MTKLIDAATATVTSGNIQSSKPDRTFQATVVGTGAVTATIIIEATNDDIAHLTLGTITLSGTTSASDGFASSAQWRYVRARITAISGTGAAVTVTMGA